VALDGAGNVFVKDYGNHRIIVFQVDAVPVAPALPERGRPLLAGHDGAAHLRVFQDARVRAPLRALGDASASARREKQELAAAGGAPAEPACASPSHMPRVLG